MARPCPGCIAALHSAFPVRRVVYSTEGAGFGVLRPLELQGVAEAEELQHCTHAHAHDPQEVVMSHAARSPRPTWPLHVQVPHAQSLVGSGLGFGLALAGLQQIEAPGRFQRCLATGLMRSGVDTAA